MNNDWTLTVLAGRWWLYRLPGDTPWPPEALHAPWAFLARTPDEVSLLLPEGVPAPQGSRSHGPLAGLRVEGPLAFDLVGVLAALSRVLAAAGISVLAWATYDTDYLFVPAAHLADACRALGEAGYHVVGRDVQ